LVYILSVLAFYWAVLIGFLSSYRGLFFYAIAFSALTALVVFRSNVGIDTVTYERLIYLYGTGYEQLSHEVGFEFLAKSAYALTGDAVVSLRLIGGVVCFFFFVAFLLAGERGFYLYALFIIPMAFFDLSMNGVRLGLGAGVFLIGYELLLRGKQFWFHVFSFLAIFLFHYSILFCYFFLVLLSLKITFVRLILGSVLAVFFGFLLNLLLYDYLFGKFSAYSDYAPPGDFSGIRYVSVLAIFLLYYPFSSLSVSARARLMGVTGLMLVLCGGLAMLSYAGLRLLQLSVLVGPLLYLLELHKGHVLLQKKDIMLLLITGAISFIFLLRGFYAQYGVGDSPFLPYNFIFYSLEDIF
jgi:hypothetical protein